MFLLFNILHVMNWDHVIFNIQLSIWFNVYFLFTQIAFSFRFLCYMPVLLLLQVCTAMERKALFNPRCKSAARKSVSILWEDFSHSKVKAFFPPFRW